MDIYLIEQCSPCTYRIRKNGQIVKLCSLDEILKWVLKNQDKIICSKHGIFISVICPNNLSEAEFSAIMNVQIEVDRLT